MVETEGHSNLVPQPHLPLPSSSSSKQAINPSWDKCLPHTWRKEAFLSQKRKKRQEEF